MIKEMEKRKVSSFFNKNENYKIANSKNLKSVKLFLIIILSTIIGLLIISLISASNNNQKNNCPWYKYITGLCDKGISGNAVKNNVNNKNSGAGITGFVSSVSNFFSFKWLYGSGLGISDNMYGDINPTPNPPKPNCADNGPNAAKCKPNEEICFGGACKPCEDGFVPNKDGKACVPITPKPKTPPKVGWNNPVKTNCLACLSENGKIGAVPNLALSGGAGSSEEVASASSPTVTATAAVISGMVVTKLRAPISPSGGGTTPYTGNPETAYRCPNGVISFGGKEACGGSYAGGPASNPSGSGWVGGGTIGVGSEGSYAGGPLIGYPSGGGWSGGSGNPGTVAGGSAGGYAGGPGCSCPAGQIAVSGSLNPATGCPGCKESKFVNLNNLPHCKQLEDSNPQVLVAKVPKISCKSNSATTPSSDQNSQKINYCSFSLNSPEKCSTSLSSTPSQPSNPVTTSPSEVPGSGTAEKPYDPCPDSAKNNLPPEVNLVAHDLGMDMDKVELSTGKNNPAGIACSDGCSKMPSGGCACPLS
jgi:hypothetical protein